MGLYCNYLILLVSVMVSIPFLTLFERKFLGYIQSRQGPKKVSFQGFLQPIFDGMKLMVKESSFPSFSNFFFFFFSPFVSFIMMIFLWLILPFYFNLKKFNLSLLVLICFSSLKIYTLIGSGWSSNSKYSLLGSLRGASQVMSYEVCLIFLILMPSLEYCSFNLWIFFSGFNFLLIFNFFMVFLWLMMILAETKRSPFDFAEGESELVSGFNTEYSSLSFAFLFLGEYGKIILISFLSVLFFFFFPWIFFCFFGLMFVFFMVWSRGTFPRFRYDFLMLLAWKVVLPFSLFFLYFMFLGF